MGLHFSVYSRILIDLYSILYFGLTFQVHKCVSLVALPRRHKAHPGLSLSYSISLPHLCFLCLTHFVRWAQPTCLACARLLRRAGRNGNHVRRSPSSDLGSKPKPFLGRAFSPELVEGFSVVGSADRPGFFI
jgi:hypothetical protein